MDYNKLVSVTGLGGLYELMSSKADGGIVKSLEDKSTKFVSTRLHSFSHLESIEVFTTNENVNLVEVFNAMKQSEEPLPDGTDAKLVKSYFEKVFPAMDFDRVYGSDMKKMVKWFGLLAANEVEIKLSENHEQEGTAHDAVTPKAKINETKPGSFKAAPPKKINSPRKMA